MTKHLKDQRELYNDKAETYMQSHGSDLNQLYRDKAYRDSILDIDLENKLLLDAMCGPGVDTSYFIKRNSDVFGLDISDECARLYNKVWKLNCQVASIHHTKFQPSSFDVIYIGGGLHHILPNLDETIAEISRILKPGGSFCFVEPNADTILNAFRNIWYKLDNRFGDDEGAISYKKTMKPFLDKYGFREEKFFLGGNIAYLLIDQSGIFNLSYKLKRFLFKPLLMTEFILSKIPFFPKLFFAARWVKKT